MRFMAVALAIWSLAGLHVASGYLEEDGAWKPTKIVQAIGDTSYGLSQWPDAKEIEGEKRVKSESSAVLPAKSSSAEWVRLILDPKWLPPKDAKAICLRNDFNGRDTVRMRWEHDGYRVEASQTSCVLALKVTPVEGGTGEKLKDRTEYAKALCQEIFTDNAYMNAFGGQGGPRIPVDKLKERIAAFSFESEKVVELPTDRVVVGFEKSKPNGQILVPDFDYVEDNQSRDPVAGTAESQWYWFRNVRWWNDGRSVGFYFLKTNGHGAWLPVYFNQGSGKWFRDPKAEPDKR